MRYYYGQLSRPLQGVYDALLGGFCELAPGTPENIELHKPYLDPITFKCEKCGGTMRREKAVIDCWFDSGSMPFAQWHYPFENKEQFERRYPANYISEAIDQTRGWY